MNKHKHDYEPPLGFDPYCGGEYKIQVLHLIILSALFNVIWN